MARGKTAFSLVAAMLVAGCDSGQSLFGSTPSTKDDDGPELRISTRPGRLRVWTDSETGCQYLIRGTASRGSITPRIKPDGLPLCKTAPAPAVR